MSREPQSEVEVTVTRIQRQMVRVVLGVFDIDPVPADEQVLHALLDRGIEPPVERIRDLVRSEMGTLDPCVTVDLEWGHR